MRLSRPHERLVLGIAVLVLLSGGGWLVLHYVIARPDAYGTLHHPQEPWMLRIHGAAAMASLVVLGTLGRDHMRRAWRLRRHRFSGGTVLAASTVLVASGYGLYYVGSETVRPWISLLHWGVGLAAGVVLLIHQRAGHRHRHRRGQRRLPAPHSTATTPATQERRVR